ncbi:MAG: hypothetical protein ABR976_01425 [Terracidiphilus sp.]|jgi:hypothetical protein
MKFSFAGLAALAATGMLLVSLSAHSPAQTTPAQSSPAQTAPAAQPAPAPAQTPATSPTPAAPDQHKGQVIFSRSTDENGETTTQVGPAATTPAVQMAAEPIAQDAERQALTFTAYDIDVHLRTAEQHIAVRALVTVRNDGKSPLIHIPLQISSALNWERIRIAGPEAQIRDVTFPVATLNSDTDHTGQLHEAAITLAEPLAPGATLSLDVMYSGAIALSAQRLESIGTPTSLALHSDWDQIGVSFTGLRGFGNVVWYPVSSLPVILGDGARLFDEIGRQKLHLYGARFRLRLAAEFPHGQPPTVAVVNGHPAKLAVTESGTLDGNQEVPGVATADTGPTLLGFETPSLFLAVRNAHPGDNLTAYTLPEDEVSVDFFTAAATAVKPFLEDWLGPKPRTPLTLLDLPDPQDAPFETGALLAIPLHEAPTDQLRGALVHSLTRAWLTPSDGSQPPPAWLDEGAASFMGTLWTEKQHGRTKALEELESARPAVALAEPSSPGESAGQPLPQAIAPVYYRTKAAYVLWMLRDLAGDPALAGALRSWDPADPGSFQKLLQSGSSQTGPGKSLAWFFADWVNADKGLPDLSIDGFFPTPNTAGNWLAAVSVTNNGYAAAEVPVTVQSDATSVTQRLLVPARGKAVQRILIQGKPTQAQVNDGTVPESQASIHITTLNSPASDPSSSSSQSPLPQP